jgi:hypothetical protein
MLYPQVAALKGAAKFQTLMVCSIEDFLPAPVARAFGPAAARVGGAGREIEFASLIDNDGAFKRHPHKAIRSGHVVAAVSSKLSSGTACGNGQSQCTPDG